MKGSEFVFDYVHLLYYKCHKTNPNCGGSYTDSPNWIKNGKATINPINKKDNKCFQYAVTVMLYYGEIGKNPKRITNIKAKVNRYKWEGIDFQPEKDDWKKIEKNKATIALNVLYTEKGAIYPAYISINNSNCEKKLIQKFDKPPFIIYAVS